MYELKDKLISIRVNSKKLKAIQDYLLKNKYKTWPCLSFSRLVDEAMDMFIKENNLKIK